MKIWTIEFLNQAVEAEFEGLPAEVRAKTLHISNLIKELKIALKRAGEIKNG